MIPQAPPSRNGLFAAPSLLRPWLSWLSMLRLNTRALGQGTGPITVNAGPDQTITLPNTAALDGSADGGVGVSLTYTWSEVNGPVGATVSFAALNAAHTTAEFSMGGVYTLRLTASDGVRSGQDDVVITVNQP